MTTNISIMDDGYNSVPQLVGGVYALYQTPAPAAAPLGTVAPDEDDDVKATKAAVEAKVVTSPSKAAAKAAASSASVVTK